MIYGGRVEVDEEWPVYRFVDNGLRDEGPGISREDWNEMCAIECEYASLQRRLAEIYKSQEGNP